MFCISWVGAVRQTSESVSPPGRARIPNTTRTQCSVPEPSAKLHSVANTQNLDPNPRGDGAGAPSGTGRHRVKADERDRSSMPRTARAMDIGTYLRELSAEQVLYYPNPGNAGDALIAHATFQVLEDSGIDYRVLSPSDDVQGRVLLFGGGGALVPEYSSCADFIARHHRRARRLVLLPHTVDGHAALLQQLGDNVDLICREPTSYEYACGHAPRARAMLMDDLALGLDVSRTLQPVEGLPILDRSSPRQNYRFLRQNLRYHWTLLRRTRAERPVSPRVLNCFRTDREKSEMSLPDDNLDVSTLFRSPRFTKGFPALIRAWTWQVSRRILHYLKRFDEIRTNRLHMGIAGGLLGKQVRFHPNSYWKNEAVYRYSMQPRFPNVVWVGPDRDPEA